MCQAKVLRSCASGSGSSVCAAQRGHSDAVRVSGEIQTRVSTIEEDAQTRSTRWNLKPPAHPYPAVDVARSGVCKEHPHPGRDLDEAALEQRKPFVPEIGDDLGVWLHLPDPRGLVCHGRADLVAAPRLGLLAAVRVVPEPPEPHGPDHLEVLLGVDRSLPGVRHQIRVLRPIVGVAGRRVAVEPHVRPEPHDLEVGVVERQPALGGQRDVALVGVGRGARAAFWFAGKWC